MKPVKDRAEDDYLSARARDAAVRSHPSSRPGCLREVAAISAASSCLELELANKPATLSICNSTLARGKGGGFSHVLTLLLNLCHVGKFRCCGRSTSGYRWSRVIES